MKRFSAYWSEKLEAAIKKQAAKLTGPYNVSMMAGNDFEAIKVAVNQGIDSHLEVVDLPDQHVQEDTLGKRWHGAITPSTLHVLVRRLMESGNENAALLATDICGTLDIELI